MSVDAAEFAERRLHPLTMVHRLLTGLPKLALLLLPLLRHPDGATWFTVGLSLAYGLVAAPVIALQYSRFRYRLTGREVVIRSGVVTRRHRVIPLDRVQNISVEQGLLERLLGIARVRVETAGSEGPEGEIAFVGVAEAERIRTAARAEGPAEAQGEAAAAAPLFALSRADLLRAGAFRLSLVYVALAFSALQYLDLEPADVVRFVSQRDIPWLVGRSPAAIFVLAVVMAVVLSWLTGLLVTVNKYWGFRLYREGERLTIRSGLLTHTDVALPVRKVQALVLRTNPLLDAFGFARLDLQTVGIEADKGGPRTAAPLTRVGAALALGHALLPFTPPPELAHVSPRFVRRRFVRYAALPLLAAPGLAVWRVEALALLLLVPLAYLLARAQYRQHAYALEAGTLFVRRGWLNRRFHILPAGRVQAVSLTASPMQRREGLRTLRADTAGAEGIGALVVDDLERGEALRLRAELVAAIGAPRH